MSATTFISWCGIYLAVCLLQDAVTIDKRTTKACYGSEGLNCTKHTIICNSTQKIAIIDAYFTYNRKCGAVLSHCQDVNPDTLTVRRQSSVFDNAELISLFDKCSTKRNCSYQAPRRKETYTFSVIKYRCIDGDSIIPITGGSQRNASDTTIMYMHSNKGEGSLYTCTVQSQTPVNVTAFDVRLGDGNESQNCSVLIINTKHFTCSNVIEPYQQFERIQSTDQSAIITLQVTEGTRPVVWLRITSKRNVFISCNTTVLTRPTASTAGVTALMGSTGRSPNTTDSSPNRTCVITGAVVGTLIFVAVVVVLVWCWRKRKVDKTPLANIPRTTLDGQRNTSLSAANSPQQSNYDEIDDLRQQI